MRHSHHSFADTFIRFGARLYDQERIIMTKKIVVGTGFIPSIKKAESQTPAPLLPSKPRKGILSRMLEIVVEDIKSVFKMDQKSRENKMQYEAFMEMCRK